MHAKARIKAQASEGNAKFGAANSAAHKETTQNVEKHQVIDDGGMKVLEGYFDNLTAAAVNENSVLEQLVVNNTKLVATNKNLVAMVKNLTNDINNLERETSGLKKGSQSSRGQILYHHCKKEGYHAPKACYKLAKNKSKCPPGWRTLL